MDMIRKILPHICIVLAIVMLVFLIIDQVNSAMAFIDNQGTKIIMIVFCALVLALAGFSIAQNSRPGGRSRRR